MKKGLKEKVPCIALRKKILYTFKLVFFLTLIFCLRVSAVGYSQNKQVTLEFINIPLERALQQLELQGEIRLLYDESMLPKGKLVTVSVKNKPALFALDEILEGTSLSAQVFGDNLVSLVPAQVQDILIKGKVVDEKGLPLPGTSIKIEGATRGVVADASGNYQISAPKGATLQFSFVGFQTEKVIVNTQSVINVVLRSGPGTNLNEVVVIGYGDQTKKKITTAITTIKSADVGELPVATLGDALAAKAPGVDISSSFGGQPGEAPAITIRGLGSLGSSNSPLYVVDGYPLESASQFSTINPADIASIDILKDAASASIYGSRAANGVVIVTTKRGKQGKPRFNASLYSGIQQVSHKVELLNADEYRSFQPLLQAQRKGTANVLQNELFQGETDWQDAIFENAGMTQGNLSAAGGTESISYNLSASFLNQDGVEITSGFKNYGLRFNLDARLNPRLKLGVNIAPNFVVQDRVPNGGNYPGSIDNAYGVSIPSPVYSALLMPPVMPYTLPDGRYTQANFLTSNDLFTTNLYNPVAVLNSISNHNTNFRGIGNAFMEWTIFKDLKYKFNTGSTLGSTRRQIYVSAITPTANSATASFLNPNPNGIYAAEEMERSVDWLMENTLTYNKVLNNEHTFNVLLLQSAQKFTSSGIRIFGATGSYTTDMVENPAASAVIQGNSPDYDIYTFSSLAARINYDYKSKYLFSASLRRDGSSKFGPQNKFGTFPSVSLAWRVSEEKFMEKIRWISELKLRASYGESGNANIGSFTYLNRINNSNYTFGSSRNFGTVTSGFYNPDLTWEKNQQADLGLELGLLKDKIYLTADVYQKETSGMILNKQLLGIVGYASSYNSNTGNLRNTGLELGISSTNIKKRSFKWATNFNITFNKNKVIDLGGADNLGYSNAVTGWNNVFLIKVGRPIGDMYGFQVDGVIKNTAEAAAAPKYRSGVVNPGDMKIADINGDGFIDENDRTRIGNSLPDFISGITNKLEYKNWDASFVLQARYGGNIVNGALRNAFGSNGMNLPKSFYNNIFLSSNPEADVKYPSVTSGAPYTFVNSFTSLALENASFLRMRNVTIGYTFTPRQLKQVRLQSLRAYLSAQNVFTISDYSGYNPEVSMQGNSVRTPGIDQGVYPATRSFVAGINVGF